MKVNFEQLNNAKKAIIKCTTESPDKDGFSVMEEILKTTHRYYQEAKWLMDGLDDSQSLDEIKITPLMASSRKVDDGYNLYDLYKDMHIYGGVCYLLNSLFMCDTNIRTTSIVSYILKTMLNRVFIKNNQFTHWWKGDSGLSPYDTIAKAKKSLEVRIELIDLIYQEHSLRASNIEFFQNDADVAQIRKTKTASMAWILQQIRHNYTNLESNVKNLKLEDMKEHFMLFSEWVRFPEYIESRYGKEKLKEDYPAISKFLEQEGVHDTVKELEQTLLQVFYRGMDIVSMNDLNDYVGDSIANIKSLYALYRKTIK